MKTSVQEVTNIEGYHTLAAVSRMNSPSGEGGYTAISSSFSEELGFAWSLSDDFSVKKLWRINQLHEIIPVFDPCLFFIDLLLLRLLAQIFWKPKSSTLLRGNCFTQTLAICGPLQMSFCPFQSLSFSSSRYLMPLSPLSFPFPPFPFSPPSWILLFP